MSARRGGLLRMGRAAACVAMVSACATAALTAPARAQAAPLPRQLAVTPQTVTPAVTSSLSITGWVSNTTSLDGATSVVTAGHYAYVAAYSSASLTVVDISPPSDPSVVGSVSNPLLAGADGVFVSGRYAYVAATNSNSLVIVDVSDPSAPKVVGSVTDNNLLNEAYTVFVSGSYAYVAAQGCTPKGCTATQGNDLAIVDVSNPAAPTIVGSYSNATATDHATSVYVVGAYAYVTAAYSDTVSVIDVANPAAPTLAGEVTDSTNLPFPVDVWVDPTGQYAYVADQTNRITVLNVQNSAAPTVAGTVTASQLTGAYWLTVVGNYAFVASSGAATMAVVDVSNPASPSLADWISSSSSLKTATGVYVENGQAYVAAYGSNALTAVNVGAYVTGTDTNTPTTSISSSPSSPTTATSASFAFSAAESGSPDPSATFECRLDGGDWTMCSSPQTYSGLAGGAHSFSVRATDAAGNVDPNPPTYDWTVDTPPTTTITSGPKSITNATSASFSFSSSAANSTFQCSLDGSAWTSCTSPEQYSGLSAGSHTFKVEATDPAGNTDPNPPQFTWTIDTTPPTTTITSGPTGSITATSATFAFSSSKAGSTFQCSLDGSVWQSCSSPVQYSGLTAGNHTFRVEATDPAGNTDPAPPSWTWTVDAPPPPTPTPAPTPTSTSTPTPTSTSTPTPTLYAAGPLPTTTFSSLSHGVLSLHVSGGYKVPASLKTANACSGPLTVTVLNGKRVLTIGRIKLSASCTFKTVLRIKAGALRGAKHLTLDVRFQGTTRVAPVYRSYRVGVEG